MIHMEEISDILENYLSRHSTPEPEILSQLSRETHLKTFMPQMLSGHITGQFLKMLSMMIKPFSILEIGTFTGYSAICLAQGLAANGQMITIEKNPQMADFARLYIKKAGLSHTVKVLQGNALEEIKNLGSDFDLVYIDGDKEEYREYFSLIETRLAPKAAVIIDNTLWYGKVANEQYADNQTIKLREFNDYLVKKANFDVVILPVGDGITLARKKD